MTRRELEAGGRPIALVTLVAFAVMLLGAFGTDADAAGESCLGCPGCDSGDCEKDVSQHPLESHHHCCTTCCLAHASLALSVAQTDPAPVVAGPLVGSRTLAVLRRSLDAPYRPPRF